MPTYQAFQSVHNLTYDLIPAIGNKGFLLYYLDSHGRPVKPAIVLEAAHVSKDSLSTPFHYSRCLLWHLHRSWMAFY